MNFDFTSEQEDLRKSLREFAAAEIAPHVQAWDEGQIFPRDVIRNLGQLGVLGTMLGEEFGGAGMGYVEFAIVMEELAKVDPSVALIVAAHSSLCMGHIDNSGSDEQRHKYLPKLASGEWIGCWSLTEPSSGSDAAAARATAVLDGDSWVLNGTKAFVTNAPQADVAVIMAVSDPDSERRRISAFLVERGTPGFEVAKKENKLGMRASETAQVHLSDCRIPAGNLIGKRGHGFIDTVKNLARGRATLAALSTGIAEGALDAAVRYSKERQQFGRPIATFQAIEHKLADIATDVEASRLLTYQAAWKVDQGHADMKLAAMAKLFASEAAVRAANECVQVHGGYGFIKDYPAEKFYRDVKLCTIGEGTSEIQRMLIGRELLK